MREVSKFHLGRSPIDAFLVTRTYAFVPSRRSRTWETAFIRQYHDTDTAHLRETTRRPNMASTTWWQRISHLFPKLWRSASIILIGALSASLILSICVAAENTQTISTPEQWVTNFRDEMVGENFLNRYEQLLNSATTAPEKKIALSTTISILSDILTENGVTISTITLKVVSTSVDAVEYVIAQKFQSEEILFWHFRFRKHSRDHWYLEKIGFNNTIRGTLARLVAQ